ncbi:hypothetical protein FACS1894110_14840 [Spirochaetia bacterium]|nr:hypothetical protein FACS1894110_14840 [Spirochaetia bacterium]
MTLAIMLFGLNSGVFAGASREKQAKETSVTMAVIDVWSTLNPFASSISELSGIAQSLIYLDLARVSKTGDVMPLLLESWEASADGKTFTVKIRKNMFWHDGQPITAEDLYWTLKTVTKPETIVSSRSALADFEGLDARGVELSPGSIAVEKLDDYTLRWKLKIPKSAAAMFYDMRSTHCLPKHVVEKIPLAELTTSNYWYTNPVGSGPYKFDSMVEGERIEYTKFDKFGLGTPKIDRFILRMVPQSNLLSGLMSGDIDILAGGQYGTLPTSDVALARNQKNLIVESIPVLTYQYISLDNKGKLNDVRVRKAINLAIDKKRIVSEVLQGEGVVAALPYAASHPYFNKNLSSELDVYNPAAAKALLAEAKWDSNVVLSFGTPAGNAFRNAAAVLVQQDLADIGIKTEIKQFDNATLMTMLTAGQLDLATMGSAGAIEPNEPYNLYNPDGPYCFARLTDYTYVDYFKRGINGLNFADRSKEYFALQEYIIKQMPYSYLCNPNIIIAYNNRLKNISAVDLVNSHRAYWEWTIE